jgi:hypothetical protein
MRQNRRFGGINLLAAMAGVMFLLPTFGSAGANAQRRVIDDSDASGPQRQPGQPIQGETQRTGPSQRALPGSRPSGIIVRSDAPSVPSAVTTAGPVSSCTANPGPPGSGNVCNVFPTDAAGNHSEISNVINIPDPVVGGYLVLKHDGAIADNVVSNWTNVLKYGDGSNNPTTSMQLFSKGCNTGNPNDTSCFPPYSPGTSAFLVTSNPGPTVFLAPPSTYNVYSDTDASIRAWTTAGATGAVDEDSLALARFNLFGVNIANGQTGAVHMRYNITATEGIAHLCPATTSTIRTRFRNSDTSGTIARMTYEIRTSSISAGGNTVVYTFDSNGRGGGSGFKTAIEQVALDFNFATNMYWIEATIFRSDPNTFSDLGTIQLWETAGTPCP